jgi:predicted nucleic acid-binding protein
VIAIDTSSWIAFFGRGDGADAVIVDRALADHQACLPPVVLTELLSDPKLSRRLRALLLALPTLAVIDGYWERAGLLRAKVISKRRRAPLADTLIAQSCIDHGVALLSRDADFRSLASVSGLRLVTES